jgi:alginate O-acetyltransferase complex protein AlgI
MLVLYRVLPIHKHLTASLGLLGKWISILITFHIVCFGWIMFRATTTTILPLLASIRDLFAGHNLALFTIYGRGVVVLGAIMLFTDYLGYRKDGEFSDLFKKLNPYLAGAIIAACYFGVMILGKRESAQFIYFQF